MTVGDILDDAKYGELQQLSVKDNDKLIISYINLALLELYKRFHLRTDEQLVTLSAAQTIYTLDPAPITILGVYDEKGNEYSINDENDALSVFTVSYNKLQIPNPVDGAVVYVIYEAEPDVLTYAGTGNVADTSTRNQPVPIPASLREALLHYIGYRGHGSVNGAINAENNTHYMRFEASCAKADELNLVTRDDLVSPDIITLGYV
jgi:hypothetical protein